MSKKLGMYYLKYAEHLEKNPTSLHSLAGSKNTYLIMDEHVPWDSNSTFVLLTLIMHLRTRLYWTSSVNFYSLFLVRLTNLLIDECMMAAQMNTHIFGAINSCDHSGCNTCIILETYKHLLPLITTKLYNKKYITIMM